MDLKDERMYDLIILDSIIGSAMSSRLFQEVREERGLAYSVYSYYTSYKMRVPLSSTEEHHRKKRMNYT